MRFVAQYGCIIFIMGIVVCEGHYGTSLPNQGPIQRQSCGLSLAMDVTSCQLSDENNYFDNFEDTYGTVIGQVERNEDVDPRTADNDTMMGKQNNYFGKESDTPYQNVMGEVMVFEKEKEKMVLHGTTCKLIPAYNSDKIYRCRNGEWVNHDMTDPKPTSLTRTKRSARYTLFTTTYTRRRCTWILFWKRCRTHRYSCTIRDYHPTIRCPNIPDTYSDKLRTDAVVRWSRATANDREDGRLYARQTYGPHPYSRLDQGSYQVSYEARDKRGSTVTCSERFKVIARVCPDYWSRYGPWYGFLANGQVSCSRNNLYGSICRFSCGTAYSLSGASSSECLSNRLWSHTWPQCIIRKCPAPSPVPKGHWTACSKYTYGSICTLVCESGYNVIGSTSIICGKDETWTTPGRCKDGQAPQIKCPPDITVFSLPKRKPVTVTWADATATDNSGDRVIITSDHTSGQSFPVGKTTVVFTAQDTSGNTAKCSLIVQVQVKSCSPLSPPSQGQMTCSHGNAVGSDCSLSCPQGFNLIGVSTRTCLSSQVWSDNQPSCKRKSCGYPTIVANGKFSCPDGHDYGDSCSLKCDAGYALISPPTITCGATSTWSSAGSCQDNQAPKFPKGCPDVSTFASVLGQDTRVLFPTPEVTDNSGKRITVTSDIASGSVFQVGLTNVTFTAEDVSGNKATCILTVTVTEIQCPNPVNTNLDDSKSKVMTFSCPDGHVYGASCNISCSDGSTLGGPTAITCQRKTNTGTGYWWYGVAKPFCNAKTCPAPDKPLYGSVACDLVAGNEFCVVFCKASYSFHKVDLKNGGFLCSRKTGLWEPHKITRRMCIRGRPASGVTLNSNIYYYTNNCTADSDEIKQKFIAIASSTTIFKDQCTSKGVSCVIDSVTVSCGRRAKRSVDAVSRGLFTNGNPRNKRSLYLDNGLSQSQLKLRSRRAVDAASHITKVDFVIKMSYVDSSSRTPEFYEDLSFDLNDRFSEATETGVFDIPEAGTTDAFSYGWGIERFTCLAPTLYQAKTSMCAGCGPGYIYVSQTEPCAVCPVGTYQPEDEGSRCLPCPDGYTTKTDAAESVDECLPMCLPGTYSRTGIQPCDRCKKGSYQTEKGKNSCDLCPYGMTTISDGATSKDDCKPYHVKFNNVSDSLDIGLATGAIFDFTAVTWVRSPGDWSDTETTFSLYNKPGAAAFGCGDLTIYISITADTTSRSKRRWNHILLTRSGSKATLYVNGVEKETKDLRVFCSDLLLTFTSSVKLEELVLSGLQISQNFMTSAQVASLSLSCNEILEGNILVQTEEETESLITPSTCDDTDNCKNNPCGLKGVCLDLIDTFRCDCDDQWSGERCEIEPDFCESNQCANNGQCVNQALQGNYTCVCPAGYRGKLCTEEIVNGGWSEWSDWSQCSETCGEGTRSRSRSCDSPVPGPDGKMCEGDDRETDHCIKQPCPVDGGFSGWTAWVCPVTCGEGTATRRRQCNNPEPAYGGQGCVGSLVEAKDCENLEPCPINGAYGNFSAWSECSKSCGGGVSTRERRCDNPAPQYGGSQCDPALAVETKSCNEEECQTCMELPDPGGNIEKLNCTYNETEDMNECRIVCKKGFMTDQDKTYICGRDTQFTWSHMTTDNPRGLLPDCEEAKIAKYFTFTLIVVYGSGGLPSEAIISHSVESKLSEKLNCAICSYRVIAHITNSDGSITASVFLTFRVSNPDLDLKTASEEELKKEADAVFSFEDAIQRLVENSDFIFLVSYQNQTFFPNGVTTRIGNGCPAGTQSLNGACVNCSPGYYSISSDSICEPCPKNFYQDNAQSTSCIPCPSSTSTHGTGARRVDECHGL